MHSSGAARLSTRATSTSAVVQLDFDLRAQRRPALHQSPGGRDVVLSLTVDLLGRRFVLHRTAGPLIQVAALALATASPESAALAAAPLPAPSLSTSTISSAPLTTTAIASAS